ncbi:hypothetical protein [Parabacteroides sp. PF5-9]|uniref:hypothetical protein n=1 Tax=Parabacteroides sp. PF5-9 TaxID=1742404 RepID=UPI0024766D99|nr:hypothetical protein [Parabacteroides sp. PF5-9]MDH6356340.1 hypothetical protein [Parabacteroides sp. PF5-9]
MKLFYLILFALVLHTGTPVLAKEGKGVHPSQVSNPQNPVQIELTAKENFIIVKNAPVGSLLQIYSVVGIKVKEIEMKEPSGEYFVNIAKGYYIIRIGETVRKIAIR